MNNLFFILFSCLLICTINTYGLSNIKRDRIQEFYDRILKSDVKYCQDKTKLLPNCNTCIPGLQQKSLTSTTCDEYIESSVSIRNEISKLTIERYGDQMVENRPFGLYPYLEMPDFMVRQESFGEMLSKRNAMSKAHLSRNIMDIGAYYNPINLFFDNGHCPTSVVVIEPILDALSVMIPCINIEKKTVLVHVIFVPITFKHYMTINNQLPKPDSIVCIGCDSHYGPNRAMLETAFVRPYTLFIEYPSEYVHNKPFKHMMGTGTGEKLLFLNKFQPKTNATIYTKRVMKVIDYTP